MEWSNSKERIPDVTGHYLIIYSRSICANEMAVAFFSREDWECEKDALENAGWEYATIGDHEDVLYWRPLPSPPKGCKCFSF